MSSNLSSHEKAIPWIWLVLGLLGACALPFFISNYHVFQLSMVLTYAIALVGLNILIGYSGQISLGHGAFLAIGAYTTAILMDKADMP
jgi:branched-chain amino acid transport system permease protein